MKFARGLWSFVASTWLTVFLVLALIGLSLAGTALPQESATAPAALAQWQEEHGLVTFVAKPLGLFRTFSSWLFVAALALIALNLVACTLDRMVRLTGRGLPMTSILSGSLILHVGLLAVLTGGVVTAAYRFDARIVVTEGQMLDLGVPEGYVRLDRGPLAQQTALPRVKVGLDTFEPTYRAGQPVRFDSRLTARVRRAVRHPRVQVNRPAEVEGFGITQADFGYSPNLFVTDAGGRPLVDAYVALTSRRTATGTVFEDFVTAPNMEVFMLRVYPDVLVRNKRYVSRSPEPKNPALSVRLMGPGGTTRRQALLKRGEEAVLGDYHVTFRDLRYWSAFRVTRDPGMPIVYAGFGVCLLGLLMRYTGHGVSPPARDRPDSIGRGEPSRVVAGDGQPGEGDART